MRLLLLALTVAAAATAPLALADAAVLDISPHQLKFGKHPFGSSVFETVTLTNTGSTSVLVDIETLDVPDDFSPGQPDSTCTIPEEKLLAPGESCTHIVGWLSEAIFPGRRVAFLLVTVKDAATGEVLETHRIRMTALAVEP